MNTIEPTWPELRATNRRLLDACILLAAADPISYGSPQWTALPDSHPEKHRALWRAAEAWRKWWQPEARATRRAADADALDQAVTERLRAASRAIATGTTWQTGPTWTALQHRRYPWLSDPDWTSPGELHHGRDWHGTDHGDHYATYLTHPATGQEAA